MMRVSNHQKNKRLFEIELSHENEIVSENEIASENEIVSEVENVMIKMI